jgi:hypothetical protein
MLILVAVYMLVLQCSTKGSMYTPKAAQYVSMLGAGWYFAPALLGFVQATKVITGYQPTWTWFKFVESFSS